MDERSRRLERDAALGDQGAAAELQRDRCRLGEHEFIPCWTATDDGPPLFWHVCACCFAARRCDLVPAVVVPLGPESLARLDVEPVCRACYAVASVSIARGRAARTESPWKGPRPSRRRPPTA